MRSSIELLKKIVISAAWCLSVGSLCVPIQAKSDELTDNKYLVIGVISDSRAYRGVALIKSASTAKTFAIRVGEKIENNISIDSISQEYVSFKVREKTIRVKVGDSLDQYSTATTYDGDREIAIREGIERQGNIVKVSSSLREYVAGPSLSKILMQAAAVPHYIEGELKGFGLFEIEQDSVYERAGFVNGDVIFAINGQPLNNVGQAIRVLHSLKTESEVEVQLLRGGIEQKVLFQIQ